MNSPTVSILQKAYEEAAASDAITTTYEWETGEVKSDEQGNFAIAAHPEREFVIDASHPEFVGDVSAPARVDSTENKVFVSVTLRKGISVTGQVRDSSGAVVQGAQVRLVDAQEQPELHRFTSLELLKQRARYTVSGANGEFKFDWVNAARKTLIVLHAKSQIVRRALETTADQEQVSERVVLKSK